MRARFRKVLVANRGEIARRVLRTLREMGVASVAVYSDADAAAPHVTEADEAVRLGPAPSAESYLAGDRILEAARAVGADALHPGYGFLAENADFAARCAEAGVVFIGPAPDAIRKMGSKIEAKEVMAAAGVPVIPGISGAGKGNESLAAAAGELGFPVLVKASAGGGGKGMRIAEDEAALPEAMAAARREAASAFGDPTLLLERYFEAPRHIEIQIFGDAHGNVIHLFERECSVQRRYQKVVEEAPSPAVDAELRARMGAAAVAAGKAIGYTGAGTVEFIVDRAGDFYFLEVNTRLQVEHPVTEAVTGLDLVRLQILMARGEPLPIGQDDLAIDGHAIEVRLYAEDPESFLPATGRIALWEPPELPGLRIDSGVTAGSEVGVHYDPMLAKLIAHGPTRSEAVDRLTRALRRLGVAGVTTNRDLLLAVLEHPAFRAGETDTHFFERHLPPEARRGAPDPALLRASAAAAALHEHALRRAAGGPLPPSIPSGWRNNRWRPQDISYTVDGETLEVCYVARAGDCFDLEIGANASEARVLGADAGGISLELDSVLRRFDVERDGGRVFVHGPTGTCELVRVPRFPPPAGEELAGGCVAPMTGVIREVRVAVGERVEEGSVMLILEAMKMEHEMVSHAAGVVAEVRVEVGQMVDPDAVLIVVEPDA
jgi:acetyl-CoA carboxylase biotin carboxylase subunit